MTRSRHPEEPRTCAASRRTATRACGPSFEARPRGRAPQDDGSVCGLQRSRNSYRRFDALTIPTTSEARPATTCSPESISTIAVRFLAIRPTAARRLSFGPNALTELPTGSQPNARSKAGVAPRKRRSSSRTGLKSAASLAAAACIRRSPYLPSYPYAPPSS
jgi:hypothetical protein